MSQFNGFWVDTQGNGRFYAVKEDKYLYSPNAVPSIDALAEQQGVTPIEDIEDLVLPWYITAYEEPEWDVFV